MAQQAYNKAIVWSKNGCGFCVSAKRLLEARNIPYEERNISKGEWSKADLLKAVPDAKTVPQVFLDEELIGGYDKLLVKLGG